MPLRAAILGKILLVRQPIAQALGALDFETFEFSDFSELVSRLDLTSPSLIVMDADGMSREWRTLAAGQGARRGAAALVLVTSRFSFDDAHDAMALKVAGVIMKPFRGQHTQRLLDLALRQMNIRARRASPRFAVPAGMNAVLRLSEPGSKEAFPLKNISEGGAAVDVESGRPGSLLDIGAFVPSADIIWGDVQLEAAIDVVYRDEHTARVRFSRFFDGAPKFLRALKERHHKAAGSEGIKRKW
jgi:DNA-binding NarL/FixJ family response regulator